MLIFSVASTGSASPLPGTPEWQSGFDGMRALEHVKYLASDVCRGRYSGFAGADVADRYIAEHFQAIGLEKPFAGDGYFHRFAYGAGEYVMPSGLVVHFAEGRADTAKMWQHMNIFKYSGFGKVSGKVVMIGYGVSAPELGWDDYAGVDVKGAIVLAWRGTPSIEGKDFGSWNYSGRKTSYALERGAAGFIYCETDPPKLATIMDKFFQEKMPAVWVSKTFADSILRGTGKTKDEWKKLADSTKTPVSLVLNVTANLQVSGKYYPRRKTDNLAGMLIGSDPVLKNEVVVIGAHMDHHGVDAAGNLYPGADDNASGTATMMELARVFAEKKVQHKRSILFIGFAGEEEGLVGSKAFVKNPMLPRGMKVTATLNMDMVGQGNCSLGVGGVSEFPVLGKAMFAGWSDSTLRQLDFWGLYDGSDHASFRDYGIPSYVIGALGDHPNYHTPGDSAGNVKPEVLKTVGDMVYHCAVALADYPEPLAPMISRGEWAIQRYGGFMYDEIEAIQTPAVDQMDYKIGELSGSPWPIEGRVHGVEYPIPLVVTRLGSVESNGGGWKGADYFRAIEAVRGKAQTADLPVLADSVRKDFYKLAPFLGVTFAIDGKNLPKDELELKALARSGVGFVIANPDYELGAELAAKAMRAGLRLWLQFPHDSAAVQAISSSQIANTVKLVELWQNQVVCDLSVRGAGSAVGSRIELADALLAKGAFVVTDDTNYLLSRKDAPEYARMGIPMDSNLTTRLLEANLNENKVGDLLYGNLQRTLQGWWQINRDVAVGQK